MSLLDEEIPLHEDTDQSWTFRQSNSVELDETGSDAVLVETGLFNQNGLDASTVRRRDDWEEDSGCSLSSSEWGPLVADELTFEPFRRRTIKPATRCRVIAVAALVLVVVALIVLGVVLGLQSATKTKKGGDTKPPPYQYEHAAVAADAGPCSEIGRDILKKDGSAVDAAISTLVCVGLYNAQSTGIGGGHFLLYYHRSTQAIDMIDARESAPLHATKDMYNSTEYSSTLGGSSVAVPGEVAGFEKAHNLYGNLKWKTLFEPSIKLAREGFHATRSLAKAVELRIDVIRADPLFSEIFIKDDGTPIQEDDIIYRPKYADTLEKIANGGADAFYKGELAEDIVADIQEKGGIITLLDLEQYRAKKKTPLAIQLDNEMRVYSPPPPSSGAVLSMILNILDGYKFNSNSFSGTSATTLTFHRIVEAFKFAYAKRAYLGDVDFVAVTQLIANMTSRKLADILITKISDDVTHDSQYYGLLHSVTEDHGTTHLCILDQNGNAVSVTASVNLHFGSKVLGRRTGIVYNNEMDDFSKPGTSNYFGFPPSETNFIEPGKRPMSSMTPTIVTDKEGNVRLVVGSAGGSRIITSIAQTMIMNIWGGFSVSEAITRRRLHHQWIPDEILYEEGFEKDVLTGLQAKGHKIAERENLAVVQAISRSKEGVIQAFSDERKGGYPAGF